jgi:hypothetical protein
MSSISDTSIVVASGGLVELGYSQFTSNVAITSTTAGSGDTVISPLTVVCDGSPIVVEFFAPQVRPGTNSNEEMSISLYEDGSEETRQWGRFYNGAGGFDNKPAHLARRLTPSAGSHTYSVKAYVNAGSGSVGGGSGGTSSAPGFLRVSKIVEATQWPAVTTGTIICTSSTRPASPFEGQVIYETDTGLSLIYDGSAWVSPSVTHKPPSVKLERTTGQVVYDASAAIIVWDSEVWDTDGMHDNATNQDRITINTPGIYLVIGAVRYNAGISDDSSVTIWQNGSTFIVRDEGGPANTAGGRTVSALVNMNANDYLHLQVYQNNSANTSRTTTSGTFFSAAWIGQA